MFLNWATTLSAAVFLAVIAFGARFPWGVDYTLALGLLAILILFAAVFVRIGVALGERHFNLPRKDRADVDKYVKWVIIAAAARLKDGKYERTVENIKKVARG